MSALDYVAILAPPVAGLAGVWLGGRYQAKKDDARWERERDRETERWRRDDDLLWLSEKHRLYTDLMSAQGALFAVARRLQFMRYAPEGTPPPRREPPEIKSEMDEAVRGASDAVEAVGILASTEVYEIAQEVLTRLFQLRGVLSEARTTDELSHAVSQTAVAMSHLRAVVRAELRVDAVQPGAKAEPPT